MSGYARRAGDLYITPRWVTEALIPFLPSPPRRIWEPAAGATGAIAWPLAAAGFSVVTTDINDPESPLDFLATADATADGVVSNPPVSLAQEFIEHALDLSVDFAAMLLRVDFDSAKTRRHLFADCPIFAGKVVLTRRIRWFEGSTGSPSYNHCWFIWNWNYQGLPTIAYAPPANGGDHG